MVSNHYNNYRNKREVLIEKIVGIGEEIDLFVVDRGHINGLEDHIITNTGVIVIKNHKTQKLVTKLIARPHQISRYYEQVDEEVPDWLLEIAREHKKLGYNDV